MKKNISTGFRFIIGFSLILVLSSGSIQAQDPTRFEESILKFEEKDKLNPVEPGAILFVGSSSIVFWPNLENQFPGHSVLNRGFGGSHFSDLLYYFDRVVLPYKPSKIFVYEGDNDISAGKDLETILEEAKRLRNLISEKVGKHTEVVFISPKPSVARWDFKGEYEALNAALKDYTDKTPHTQYADVWTPAIGEDGKVLPHIFVADNLHMNAEGYKIWIEVIENFID